jgi:hypothetical protein
MFRQIQLSSIRTVVLMETSVIPLSWLQSYRVCDPVCALMCVVFHSDRSVVFLAVFYVLLPNYYLSNKYWWREKQNLIVYGFLSPFTQSCLCCCNNHCENMRFWVANISPTVIPLRGNFDVIYRKEVAIKYISTPQDQVQSLTNRTNIYYVQ